MTRLYVVPLSQFFARHERALLAAVLCLGLLIRLPFVAADFRITGDLSFFRQWARTISEEGLVVLAQTTNTPIYQPIALYLMGLAGRIEALSPAALRGDDRLLNALIKLPPIVADVLIAGLAAWALRVQSAWRRIATAALYVFTSGRLVPFHLLGPD